MCARIGQISPRIGSTSTSAAKPIGHNWAFSRSATCCRTLRGSRADFGLDLLNGIHPAGDGVVFPAAGNCAEGWQRAYDQELQSVFISCPRLARLAHCLSRQGKRYDMTPAMGLGKKLFAEMRRLSRKIMRARFPDTNAVDHSTRRFCALSNRHSDLTTSDYPRPTT